MSLTESVAALFKARAGEWIDARQIMQVGGAFAWRTRISDLRRFHGMTIENRWSAHHQDGRRWRDSQYRYIPA